MKKKILFYAVIVCAVNCISCTQTADSKISGKSKNHVITICNEELSVVLGNDQIPSEKRLAELLAERIKDRSGISLAKSAGKSKYQLVIGTAKSNDKIKAFSANRSDVASLGPDGYCIVAGTHKSELYVIGESDSGVVAGVGRLMREMKFEKGKLVVSALEISETPQMPNRGMYLWARRYYFDKPDRLDRYIEELALWGCNGISFWFEMAMFNSFEDTTGKQNETKGWYTNYYKKGKKYLPQEWIAKYKRFYNTARRMGMKTGLNVVANDAYMSSPKEMRIKPIIGAPDWAMCPSKPGSVKQMIAWQEEVFRALSPIDIYTIFPADPGGCSCQDCTPWPTSGFWKIAKPLGDRVNEISPETEIWVGTWHLNHPTFGGKDWMNLVDSLDWSKGRPEWFAGFEISLAPHHKYARNNPEEREHYNKAKQPLMVFPDISMWGNHKGMLVNKNYWKQLQDELNDYSPELMKGGWPYTERWNTDVANVVFLSFFWDSKKSVDAVIDEYARFYFGTEAETGRQLLELLDDSCKDSNRKQKIRETLAKLEDSLPQWIKSDWRWDEIVKSCNQRRFK